MNTWFKIRQEKCNNSTCCACNKCQSRLFQNKCETTANDNLNNMTQDNTNSY